jgi:hypothetical protein
MSSEPLLVLCDVLLKVTANKVIKVKSGQKSIHFIIDGCQFLSRMVPSNSELSWTKNGDGIR